jgi:putative acetyltransferase
LRSNQWGEMTDLRFCEGDLDRADVRALLAEHVGGMAPYSPPESIHALPVEGLRTADVTFWSVRDADALVGMGALKEIDATHGELKSMRTVASHRRKGIGARTLEHLIAVARARGYRRLSLETGTADFFAPARALYSAHGFQDCAPFEGYGLDPYSCFMMLELD